MTKTLFPEAAIEKAQRCIDKQRVTPDKYRDGSYYVEGSMGVPYRVTIDYDGPRAVWATCTCPHGRRRFHANQTLCYHATAALLTVLHARGEGMSSLLQVEEA